MEHIKKLLEIITIFKFFSFPKSYVESSHRREWFEKLDRARENNPAASDDGETGFNPATSDDGETGLTRDDVHEDEVVTIERGKLNKVLLIELNVVIFAGSSFLKGTFDMF